MSHHPERVVSESVRRAAQLADAPLLLAVSGGLDSMVLMCAMASAARERIAAVATFDHGTGDAATRAAAHVEREAARLGLPVIRGALDPRTKSRGGLEATWRRERHHFLRAAAARLGARIATAHTRDDQMETVLMRVLRGSGTRGLAALSARSTIVRPLLDVRRSELETFAATHDVTWIDDPSNASPRFLRNRVRRDLLPALRRVYPSIDETLLSIGREAAAWRDAVDVLVAANMTVRQPSSESVVVATSELADYDRSSLSVLWGAIAGLAGLALDRRGTQRCATFTMKQPRNGHIPLSGGWRLESRGGELFLHRSRVTELDPAALPDEGALEWGGFRFTVSSEGPDDGRWQATLPEGRSIRVRCWRPGDRLVIAHGRGARRVKRYLSDAGVHGSERESWPVVTFGDEIVWIPGVRRSDAATAPSGGSARHYLCERTGS
ncbi:MAG TPA: tRNA lysidine(34) synthetase TilS [Gemmatimonadaceae bacterium]|jgi:tRNA(Ile)-lysidine synthase|nr:tRNA lysidine(34) synthetase TilS [Gemmatimonadaceae bacterium]